MKNMKKIVVSLFVIESFIAYAYYIRVYKNSHAAFVEQKKVTTDSVQVKNLKTPTLFIVKPTTTLGQPKNSLYKDGIYLGSVANAVYGNIQVQLTITNGAIAKVDFLQYPHDQETSISINQQSNPVLAQEAIHSQSANVDIVSGATLSSQAYIQSLQSALLKAKN